MAYAIYNTNFANPNTKRPNTKRITPKYRNIPSLSSSADKLSNRFCKYLESNMKKSIPNPTNIQNFDISKIRLLRMETCNIIILL